MFSNLNVAVYHDQMVEYPDEPPYSPDVKYPENLLNHLSKRKNSIYNAVRNTLLLLGLDKDGFNNSQWNPLKDVIKPGDTVIVKPNFVLSNHEGVGDLFSITTHPAVIRAVVDYVYIALAGKGRIVIADAPQMDCNFSELLEKTGLESIRELYKKELDFDIEIYDLRDFWLDKKGKAANSRNRHKLPGDPLGGVLVNLGKKCGLIVAGFNLCAVDLVCTRLMGFDYNKIKMLNYIMNKQELFKVNFNKIEIALYIRHSIRRWRPISR